MNRLTTLKYLRDIFAEKYPQDIDSKEKFAMWIIMNNWAPRYSIVHGSDIENRIDLYCFKDGSEIPKCITHIHLSAIVDGDIVPFPEYNALDKFSAAANIVYISKSEPE